MTRVGLLIALATMLGCTAEIGGIASENHDDPWLADDAWPAGDESLGGLRRVDCDASASDVAGPRLLRRLTGAQITRVVREGLGLDAGAFPGHALPPDAAAPNGFTNSADRLVVNETFAGRLRDMALDVGALVSEEPHRSRLLPCASGGGRACAETYLETIGRRLYRRPLTGEERARYLALFDDLSDDEGIATFIHYATAAMLQSPHVVYRLELGTGSGDRYVLDGYERATALAFAFTGGPPDDAMLDAAARDDFDTEEGLIAAARTLLTDADDDEAARAFVDGFAHQWLGVAALPNLARDASLYPGFDAAVKASMAAELRAYLEAILLERGGGIEELLTGETTFLDGTLSSFYGFGDVAGDAFVEVDRPETFGLGLLSLGAIQTTRASANSTSPTLRGKFVRTRILCGDVPDPPPTVGDVPEPTPATTTRERYEDLHANTPVCAGCHEQMDPIGFGFESLDAVGRYRAEENGFPIDATGYVLPNEGNDGDTRTFDGPHELATTLAAMPEAEACFAAFLGAHVYGLPEQDTRCMLRGVAPESASLDDLVLALVRARHFQERR